MTRWTRRDFCTTTLGLGAALSTGPFARALAAAGDKPGQHMSLGLVTYLWGKDWDLPTLVANCEKSKVLGVELRTQHAHGVEPSIDKKRRAEVKARFDASPVTLVGLGTNQNYDSPDPKKLAASIEGTKAFVKLGHDVGATGVKVKPNDLHKEVPQEKTIAQIGKALNEVGAFASDYGQQIRLEVHGSCSALPIIRQIMDVADHPNVFVCWNSNTRDLEGEGLAHNFNLVKDRFGATAHVRSFEATDYPWPDLIALLVKMDYHGWLLLEARGTPEDPVAALIHQRELFEKMVAKGQAAL